MKLPGYNYRTGNPRYDNQSRQMNKALRAQLAYFQVATPRGRRRKKQLVRVEGATYLRIISEVAFDLWRKERSP